MPNSTRLTYRVLLEFLARPAMKLFSAWTTLLTEGAVTISVLNHRANALITFINEGTAEYQAMLALGKANERKQYTRVTISARSIS